MTMVLYLFSLWCRTKIQSWNIITPQSKTSNNRWVITISFNFNSKSFGIICVETFSHDQSPLFPQLGESERSRAQLRHTLEEVESSRQDEHHSEVLEAALQERDREITTLRATERQKVCWPQIAVAICSPWWQVLCWFLYAAWPAKEAADRERWCSEGVATPLS